MALKHSRENNASSLIKTVSFFIKSFGFWIIVALYFILQNYIESLPSGREFPLLGYSIHQICNFSLWAILTPIILVFYRKIELDKSIIKKLSLIIVFGFSLSLIHSFAHNIISLSLRSRIVDANFSQYLFPDKIFQIGIASTFNSFTTYILLIAGVYSFHIMNKNREQETLNAKLEATISQVKLQTLKGQLHPHFLFNTLNSISSLIIINPDHAQKMLIKLSALLRYTLDHDKNQFALVKDEIDVTKKYLDIEKMRLGERLVYQLNVDERVMNAELPFLLLQPLVENSIVHGISPKRAHGKINVSIKEEKKRLKILVSDNGQAPNVIDDSLFEQGLGLSITRKRLEEAYPTDHDIKVSRNSENGLDVSIMIPLNRQNKGIKYDKPFGEVINKPK